MWHREVGMQDSGYQIATAMNRVHKAGFRVLQLFSHAAPPVQLLRPFSSGGQDSFDGPGDAEFSGRSDDDSVSQLRAQLLDTALDGGPVKAHGWSTAALTAAAAELKLSPAVTGILKRWVQGSGP